MKKLTVLAVAILLAFGAGAAAAQNLLIQELGFTDVGGNDAISTIRFNRDSSDNGVIQFLSTTSDTLDFTFTPSGIVLADSNYLAFGTAAADGNCQSDGTNIDCTITALMTLGDGGTTNYTSISATGAQIWLGSAQATLNDNVELNFGTSAGESTIASNGTDTTWTVTSGDLVLGTDGFLTRIEGAMQLGAVSTFTDSDATPNVAGNSYWNTNTTTVTITDFDGSGIEAGQIIVVISKGTIAFDVTTSGLKGGSTDLTTASGDFTAWFYDGTDWYLISFTDMSDNLA